MDVQYAQHDSRSQPLVALIVLNHERRELLLESLCAARATTYSPCRLVVVDNGSTDGSADAVECEFPDIIVLRSPTNAGVAGGRNIGAKWVLGNLDAQFVLFLDNDSLVEPDTLAQLIRPALEDRNIGLVAPKAYRHKGDDRLLSAGGLRFNPYTGVLDDFASGEPDQGQHDQPRDIQACPGFAFLVRREVFERIGFFDEHFNPYGWEDADFSLRAAKAGFRNVYAPRAVVYHLGGRIGRGPVANYEYHKARSMLYFMRRHTTFVQWISFLVMLPFRAVVRVAKELMSGRFNVVSEWMHGVRPSRHGDRR
jgi:hypothetical protein